MSGTNYYVGSVSETHLGTHCSHSAPGVILVKYRNYLRFVHSEHAPPNVHSPRLLFPTVYIVPKGAANPLLQCLPFLAEKPP